MGASVSLRLSSSTQNGIEPLLRALELASRTPKQEASWAPVPETLTVEHVMPQSWDGSGHYPLEGANDDLRIRRNRLVHTFGNLTLLTQPLNSSVSNGPFLDHERNGATVEGKRSGFRGSLLLLNAYFLNPSMTTWEEEQIVCRGEKLLKAALSLWGRPAPAAQEG